MTIHFHQFPKRALSVCLRQDFLGHLFFLCLAHHPQCPVSFYNQESFVEPMVAYKCQFLDHLINSKF